MNNLIFLIGFAQDIIEIRCRLKLAKSWIPNDVTQLNALIATDDSSWITGSAFTIDGGIMANG